MDHYWQAMNGIHQQKSRNPVTFHEVSVTEWWDCDEEIFLRVRTMVSGWWFQRFFIFHIWDNPSHWLIFFKMVKTTNQVYLYDARDVFEKKIPSRPDWWSPIFQTNAKPAVSQPLVVLGGRVGTKARAGKNEVTYINGFPVGVGNSQHCTGEVWIHDSYRLVA